MSARPRYRPARPDDAAALARVVRAGFETYRDFAPPGWEPPGDTETSDVTAPGTFCLVAEVDGEPVGHVRLLPGLRPSPDGLVPDVHVGALFVLPAFWGTGVARTLHARALEEMRRSGARVARLFTPSAHARARRFYEREGWALHGDPYYEPLLGLELVEYRMNPARLSSPPERTSG